MLDTGLWVAVRTWWRISNAKARIRGCGVVAGLAAGLVLLGVGSGARLFARETVKEVHDKQVVLTETSHAVVVEKPVDRWNDRVITHTEYDPSCHGQVTSVTVTEEKGGEHEGEKISTTNDSEKVTETEHDTKTVTPAPDLRLQLSADLGTQPFRGGSLVVGVHADYRLIGPLTIGGFIYTPTTDLAATVVGVSVGARLP